MRLQNLVFACTALFILSFASTGSSATISGTILYDGEVPKLRALDLEADPICLSKHTSPLYAQTLVVGEDKTMANVFVYVKSGLPQKTYTAPEEPAILDQKGCQYTPHVLGVMIGQPINILNPDGTLHNVHALCKVNKEFNLAMPKFRKQVTKTFDKEEFMFPMKCDVHPWMGSWIAVMSHPFFNVTQKDGKFTIANLPAGTYEIEAWHEKLGTKTANITVGADDSKEANFTFARP